MPELPEVHTIANDLNNNIIGYEIKNIKITKNYKIPELVKKRLSSLLNKKFIEVKRIAKNIVIKLSENGFLTFHLAMTGRILLTSDKDRKDNWVKIVFEIAKNDDKKYLKFCDMRQFGKINVLDEAGVRDLENKYGLSVLNKKITPEDFLKAIHSKKTNIKNVLLDQSIISGLGNIYATDALFLARINPKTPTQSINLNESKILLEKSREILNEGIKNRGSTLPDKMYVDIFGNSGHQQNYFKIYGKDKCPSCGTKTIFEKINGRGTYFCPICQPYKKEPLKKVKVNEGQKQLL